jgi:hypothetical protein
LTEQFIERPGTDGRQRDLLIEAFGVRLGLNQQLLNFTIG